MPPLPTYFRTLLSSEPLPLSAASGEYLETLSATQVRVVAGQAIDLLGQGMGSVLLGLGLRRSEIPELLTAATLTAHARFIAIAQGGPGVGPDERDGDLLRICQRALQAVGARAKNAPRALLLPEWGADGAAGEETQRAIAALQAFLGTGGVPGELGPNEATAILRTLAQAEVPDLWRGGAPREGTPSGPAGRVVAVARGIIQATRDRPFSRRVDGRSYSYFAEDFGVPSARNEPLRAPGGVSYSRGATREYWKCNIFGGTCLALAELPVSTFQYSPGSPRHFPRAERFGDRLAQKAGWKLLRYLDHRDPADPSQPLRGAAQDGQIKELLQAAGAGDMLFVDHPGEAGEDGGHTRVCTEAAAPTDPDVAPLFAQARFERAQEQRDGMSALSGGKELQFWLLRYLG